MLFGERTIFALTALLVAVVSGGADAQQAFKVHPIKQGRLYWVEGGGGNSGIIIGNDGVIVIDAKTTADGGRQLVAEVAKLTPKPITHVIETHSDGDHVNGVVAFPDGVKIVAHANNKAEQQANIMHAAVEVDGGHCLSPADHLPNQLIMKDKVETTIHGVRLVFYHFGPAHTNGDLIVYLPGERFAFVGDLITSFVVVHAETNGSIDGWFKYAQNLLKLDVTSYLGGHAADLDTKESLRKRMEDYQALRDRVDAMVKKGSTLAEVKAAAGDPPKNRLGCRGIAQLSLAEVAYNDRISKNQELK